MSTNLEKRSLTASCSSFPVLYQDGNRLHPYDPELKQDTKLTSSHSVQSLSVIDGTSPVDYRKLLLQKRNGFKKSWHISETDSDDLTSDSSCDDDEDDALASEDRMAYAKPSLLDAPTKTDELDHDLTAIDTSDISFSETLQASGPQIILKISIPEQTFTKLPDPLNYGLFSIDLGCFFQEHKLVSEYVNKEQVAFCELRYKTRVYHQPIIPGGDSRRLCKMQGEAKRKELMRYVRQHNVEKLCKLLNKGVDPNFHTPPNGETPLTTIIANYTPGVSESVAFEYVSVPLIKALVNGGAHFDFRNQRGFSPLHVAVRNGNAHAVKALLSLGASPDSYDNSELTPLYHCSLSDSSSDCIVPLCQYGATITCVNSQKWNILHQICRQGRLAHLEAVLDIMSTAKSAEVLLNMQNESGNTALHICAIYNQQQCLLSLLNAGIDKDTRNYSHQDAFQVAVVARNMNIANLIKDFPKLSEQELSMLMHENEAEKVKPQSTKDRSIVRRHTFTSAFLTSSNKSSRSVKKRGKLNPATLSGTDIEIVENSMTTGRMVHSPSQPNVGSIASFGDGKQDSVTLGSVVTSTLSRSPKNEDTYSLATETVYEMANDTATALTEMKQTSFAMPKQNTAVEKEQNIISSSESDSNVTSADDIMMNETGDVSLQPTSHPDVFHRYRDVILSKGRDGYGFVLRGAKADKSIENFAATARHPGLQYLESVETGSNAHRVGLRAGDYILKINTIDVTCMGHRQTVDVIRKLRDPIRLRVVTVVSRSNDCNADEKNYSVNSSNLIPTMGTFLQHPPSPIQEPHRTESVRSAMGKLDRVLAMAVDFDEAFEPTMSQSGQSFNEGFHSQNMLQKETFYFDDISSTSKSEISTPPPRRDWKDSGSAINRPFCVVPPTVSIGNISNTEVLRSETNYPHQNNGDWHQFSSASNTSMTSNHITSVHVPSSPVSIDPRKGPPLPPARVDSRLSDLVGGLNPRTPPASPANSHAFGRQYTPSSTIGKVDLSGFANAVAQQAENRRNRVNSKDTLEKVTPITQHLVAKPPPAVAPKPGKGKASVSSALKTPATSEEAKPAFALALAAKHANLQQRSQPMPGAPQSLTAHKSTIRNTNIADSPKPTQEELQELLQLPPPPPIPVSDPSSPLFYNLPPPPVPVDSPSQNRYDQSVLPPPPDSMLTSARSTASSHSDRLNQRTNGVDSGSSADSGVDEFAIQPHHDFRRTVDCLSVVSSVSTLSSEDGSDAGVSVSYDPKSSPEKNPGNMYLNVLKKKKSHQQQHNQTPKPSAGVALTKVSFTSGSKAPSETPKSNLTSTYQPVQNAADRLVTQTPSSKKKVADTAPKKDVTVVDGGTTKPLSDWTTEDVCKWLTDLGMGTYTGVFTENEIVGGHLPDLEKEDLQELGVTRLGHRLTIEKALKNLTGK